jgi:ribose/xylose/arabinose/galactoside ABC-type transport system permease subunit
MLVSDIKPPPLALAVQVSQVQRQITQASIQLGAGIAGVAAMSFRGWPWWVAVLMALGAGCVAGLANGVSVAILRIPSFIGTLAIGSIAAAIELAVTKTSIFEGVSPRYVEIATTTIFGMPLRPIIAAGVALLFLVILRTTVYGRHASSIGDNPAAARLAGVPATRVRVIAFMLTGLTAGLAGVFVTSWSIVRARTGYLLPAYAAAFLGLSLGGGLRFNVLGSYLGVLLLEWLRSGDRHEPAVVVPHSCGARPDRRGRGCRGSAKRCTWSSSSQGGSRL